MRPNAQTPASAWQPICRHVESRKTLFVLAIATLGFSSAVLSGEIYKWTDADGNVHFEDRPLGDNFERLDVRTRSTNNSSVNASIVARRSTLSPRGRSSKCRLPSASVHLYISPDSTALPRSLAFCYLALATANTANTVRSVLYPVAICRSRRSEP